MDSGIVREAIGADEGGTGGDSSSEGGGVESGEVFEGGGPGGRGIREG